jgi:LPXTG-site transpeptidase (sortase) family protein
MKKENTLDKKPNIIAYFTSVFALVFMVTFGVLSLFGLVPESLQFIPPILEISPYGKNPNTAIFSIPIEQEVSEGTRPDRVIIPNVGIDSVIKKPISRDVATLDVALQSGAVHYPGSGSIERGNIFIFGHSTNWAVVQNSAYKTFNGLSELEIGDSITLEADGRSYEYRVSNVYMADDSDVLVNFDSSQRKLTISTCNTFGQKQERWVVEAELIR